MSRRGRYWPFAIAGLLLASVVANVALIVVASGDPSFAVERDYYRKALAWDAVMAQQQANADLGWSLAATLEPAASGGARLAVSLGDRAGRPLGAAQIRVEAFHGARAADVVDALLVPREDGRYDVTLPIERAGAWELRFRVQRTADAFTAVLTRELRARP